MKLTKAQIFIVFIAEFKTVFFLSCCRKHTLCLCIQPILTLAVRISVINFLNLFQRNLYASVISKQTVLFQFNVSNLRITKTLNIPA